ncbi:MAG: precorrin-3B C(17)-methyltransferase [Thiohalocapsa sp.]
MARLMPGAPSLTGPVLLVLDARGQGIAARINTAFYDLGLSSDPNSEPDQDQDQEAKHASFDALTEQFETQRPCVIVGEIDACVFALAPVLIGRRLEDAPPVVVVTCDGSTVSPLLGSTAETSDLARRIAIALDLQSAITGNTIESVDAGSVPPRPGRLAVVGLGPGTTALRAPAVTEELARTQDILGYTTYVRMAGPFRADQRILDSDNRHEMDRARAALALAAQGRQVVMVSSGDPGVFAMATAVVEALHQSKDPTWQAVDLAILPGISAAQAVAARAGAPLGHDFCVLSLSDNLKPWSQIERRLEHAATADLVIALYNPSSKARPRQLAQALALLRRHRAAATPVILGWDVGRPDERITVTTLSEVEPDQVDMRTLLIIGSSQTRQFPRRDGGAWVYTPRWYPDSAADPDPEGTGSDS